jgi:hypothetical protein
MSKKFTYFGSFLSWAYLIDLFPSITMAFDFRKLRSAYSSNAIRVLRTSDNTEQDFGFVANEVVGSDVLDFVGWNLSNWSEDLTQTAWSKSNITIDANAINDPFGVLNADVMLETVSSSTHAISKAITGVSGVDNTISFWIKAQGRDNVRITTSTGLNSRQAWLDLSTGTIVSQPSPFVDLTITPDVDSWYLVSFTETSANTTLQVSFNMSPNGSTTTYIGDITKGISIFGYQITQSSTILAYDKTEANPRGYGSISKGYDQVSGGDDLINATIIRQPIIVNNGNLITDGGKLALQGGSTLGLRSTGTIAMSGYTNLLMTFGVNVTNITTTQTLFELSSSYTANNGSLVVRIQSGVILVSQRVASGQLTEKTYPISIGRQLITVKFTTGQTAADASQVWINGAEITGTVTETNNSITLINQVLYFFARAGNSIGFLGKYQNLTMFTDEAQRAGIENNINNHYAYY